MRTRNHDWFDTNTGKTLYGFQVYHHGKWRHAAENNKPLLFSERLDRDVKRASFRAMKTGISLAVPRDAYDTQAEEIARLRAECVQLHSYLSQTLVAGHSLDLAMGMQEKSEAGEFHLPGPAAMAVWQAARREWATLVHEDADLLSYDGETHDPAASVAP